MSPVIKMVTISILLSTAPAAAQSSTGDVAAGELVARRSCAECHAMGKRPTTLGSAPAFNKIAHTKGMTQTSIQVFLRTPHEVMANYVLSPKQIRDVSAYIMDLRDGD